MGNSVVGHACGPELCRASEPLAKLSMGDIDRMHSSFLRLQCNPGVDAAHFDRIFIAVHAADRDKVFDAFARPAAADGAAQPRRCDVNDVFAAAILLSSSFYAARAAALFELFDWDERGSLAFADVVVLVGTVARGLCAATRGAAPAAAEIEALCRTGFRGAARDARQRVPLEAWLDFCKTAEARCVGDAAALRGGAAARRARAGDGGDAAGEAAAADRRRDREPPPRRSALARHPLLLHELKKEVRLLKDVYDSLDAAGSGSIRVGDFVNANALSQHNAQRGGADGTAAKPPTLSLFQADMLLHDRDGDGKVSWREVVEKMYHKYGAAVVREMATWDLALPRKGRVARADRADGAPAADEVRALFRAYDAGAAGVLSVGELAAAMADVHGLHYDDLLQLFSSAGKEPRDGVDADGYVCLFRELLQGDDGMLDILRKTANAADKLPSGRVRKGLSTRLSAQSVASRASWKTDSARSRRNGSFQWKE
ncbi:hypothetical protein M885DRAFT_584119 [Pelagophyceae sp. CCMP2097]|nr:hypothetical protein M885DRAFT_584119 [Pelagophyceae sp. CCMP2097]